MAKKKLQGTLDKQLKIYSAVAAGVLALAPSAEAAIHYSGLQNLPVNPSTSQVIDLNGDGTSEFVFGYYAGYPKGPYIFGTHNAWFIRDASLNCYGAAIRLASNYQIKSTLANQNFAWRPNTYGNLNGTLTNNCKQNFNNATGFIGVRFNTVGVCTGSDYNYGWIRYRGDTVSSGTIIDWGYEDTCNKPVAAGATDVFISKDGICSGNSPCFSGIQAGINAAPTPANLNITQDTYAENITLDSNVWVMGGWDVNFVSNSESFTTIQGSLTITNGTAIVENIILTSP